MARLNHLHYNNEKNAKERLRPKKAKVIRYGKASQRTWFEWLLGYAHTNPSETVYRATPHGHGFLHKQKNTATIFFNISSWSWHKAKSTANASQSCRAR